jgi:hypothetical protein
MSRRRIRFESGIGTIVQREETEMAKPTQEDAKIVLELAKMGMQPELVDAFTWLLAQPPPADNDRFKEKYPPGSPEHRWADQICSFFETVGVLWKHGLINEELLFDWIWVGGPWERIKGYALGLRKEFDNPRLYELFEALAAAEARVEAKVPVGAPQR